jgi:hypothetical protein
MQAIRIPARKKGHAQLLKTVEGWPRARRAWAIEGTASYGAGLCRVLRAAGERIIEIDHPARPARRNGSKTDALDAVRAAREALARPMLGEPREGDDREALRVLNTTRESAVHARTQAINAEHDHTTNTVNPVTSTPSTSPGPRAVVGGAIALRAVAVLASGGEASRATGRIPASEASDPLPDLAGVWPTPVPTDFPTPVHVVPR